MDIDKLVEILHHGSHSLVVENNGNIECFDGRGVNDLFHLLASGTPFLSGASVADKVVGKGAAALMILGNIKKVYAKILSVPAMELFEKSPICVSYGELAPNIINRKGNGICPVESLCGSCKTAEECLPLISEFINSIKP